MGRKELDKLFMCLAINRVGVRAVDDLGNCVNIGVDLSDSCSPIVNGVPETRYDLGGVRVRTMSNRVRISVPNCNDLPLVMWVICENRTFFVTDEEGNDVRFMDGAIKYLITRGLNYGRAAHGLLGGTCGGGGEGGGGDLIGPDPGRVT